MGPRRQGGGSGERGQPGGLVALLMAAVLAAGLVVALARPGGAGRAPGAAAQAAAHAAGHPAAHPAGHPAGQVSRAHGLDPATAASAAGTALDPSTFARGACVAFSPTAGHQHRTVFIDAGHGGIDPGAVGVTESGATIHEADETLPVALDTASLLRARGYRVVLSRTRATTVLRPGPGDVATGAFTLQGMHNDVAARDVCADMAKATVLLGIYFDAGTSPTNTGSVTGYDTARSFAADNHRLATLLQRDVLAHLNAHGWSIPDDGVVPDTTLGGPAPTTTAASYDHLLLLGPADPGWFTTPSTMPGALIEPLFITDPFEGTIAASSAGQQAIAAGMAQAAEQYLGSTAGTGPGRSRTP